MNKNEIVFFFFFFYGNFIIWGIYLRGEEKGKKEGEKWCM